MATTIGVHIPHRDVRSLLLHQGFQWPLSRKHSDIAYVGDIHEGRRAYNIYLYNGENPSNLHGINWFVVILDRKTYVGVYDSGLAHDCRIRAKAIVCKTHYAGDQIQFTRNGPPKKILMDGDESEFLPTPQARHKK